MEFIQGRKAYTAECLRICFAGLLLFILLTPQLVFASACGDASKDLRSSFEVTQGRGGIWGYMEKISSLRNHSMTGFQVDGKLSRIIVIFEIQCAKTDKPSKANFEKIERIIGDARMIFNLKPGRNPIKEIKAKIDGLNASLDKLIKELEA
jgi:hypothetical protein